MRDNWILNKKVFSEEGCKQIISDFSKLEPTEGTIFGDVDIRNSIVRWVENEFELGSYLLRYINLANALSFNVDIQQETDEMQFTEYSSEYKGKYDWHHDINWDNEKNFDRKLTAVILLSNPNDYEGGEFQFAEVETPKLEQGSLIIFPSYLVHRVTEITKGTRYSLVTWVRGPRWR